MSVNPTMFDLYGVSSDLEFALLSVGYAKCQSRRDNLKWAYLPYSNSLYDDWYVWRTSLLDERPWTPTLTKNYRGNTCIADVDGSLRLYR